MNRPACVDAHCEEPPALPLKQAMQKRLLAFSPKIEPAPNRLAFWLDASGVTPLYPSLCRWTEAALGAVREMGFPHAAAVTGFTKFAADAVSRAGSGAIVFHRKEDERVAAAKVPLRYFALSSKTLHALSRLDILTLGDLARLPHSELFARFGDEVRQLCKGASEALWDPLVPATMEEPILASRELDFPERDTARLAFIARRLILSLVDEARRLHLAISEMILSLSLDHAPPLCERIRPAEPTLDDVQLTELVRLKIESLQSAAPVIGISMKVETSSVAKAQLELFAQKPKRDPAAADRALARVRAVLGEDAVVKVALREGHLPEARFAFVPLCRVRQNRPANRSAEETRPALPHLDRARCLVRRIYTKPHPLQTRPVVGPGGCHFLGMEDEPAVHLRGPYIISGGWWNKEVHREYYFATTEKGRVLWVYFDRQRRRWFLHGEVE